MDEYQHNDQERTTDWEYKDPYAYLQAPPKKKRGAGKMVALALCCSLVGSAVGAGGVLLYDRIWDGDDRNFDEADDRSSNSSGMQEGVRGNSVIDITKVDTDKMMTAAEVYATNVNSTVGITTSVTTNFWGHQTTSAASGSGFILTDDGYILTNYHVIEEASAITVSFYNGESMEAELIGYDSANDIAVLKVEAEDLTPVVLGDSENANVGDSVVAIGNPLGELTFSLTTGAISAKGREVTMSTGVTMTLMQTDCAINSGNSGGALFNMYGEVIGITNAKYSSSSYSEASIDNIGFAIPIDQVRSMIESLIEKGYIAKPYIGVSVTNVSTETQSYGYPEGAAVKRIEKGSPAYKADLQINDIITHINGERITGSSDLKNRIAASSSGDVLELAVYRQGETLEIKVTVGEQTQSQ